MTIGENRLELLAVEVQEERERLLHAFLLALGVAAFGLLAGLTLTAAIVVLLWAWSPVAVLLILTGFTAPPGFVFTGISSDCCATGRRFPPRWINSEKTAHVWKKSSHEPAQIAQTTFDRGKRTQPRAIWFRNWKTIKDKFHSLAKQARTVDFTCVRRRDIVCWHCILPAKKRIRARRRKTFVAANHC